MIKMGLIAARAFAVIVLGLSATASAETLTGRVVRVADGDTVTVLDSTNTQHRIRLQGIDAPERKQPFGQKSKTYLSDLVAGKEVTVEYTGRDRYRRIVGVVLIDDIDANLRQVKGGFAWHYKKYQKEQSEEDRKKYAEAEIEARKEKIGLWQDPKPIPPWDWRRGSR
jgi:endonuclease YncB( thermonuclease family)